MFFEDLSKIQIISSGKKWQAFVMTVKHVQMDWLYGLAPSVAAWNGRDHQEGSCTN